MCNGNKIIVAASIAFAIVLGGSAAATAGTQYEGFNTIMPKFGGAGYTTSQTKAISSRAALLDQVRSGGDYNVNAKVCVGSNASCGATVPVGQNGGASLPNYLAKGTRNVVGQLWIPSWNSVNVQVSGYFASN